RSRTLAATTSGLLLELSLFDGLGWNPTSLIVWQRRIGPVAPGLHNQHFAAWRQRYNTARRVSGRDTRFNVVSNNHCKGLAARPIGERINRNRATTAQNETYNCAHQK